jgi:hypothetical protein
MENNEILSKINQNKVVHDPENKKLPSYKEESIGEPVKTEDNKSVISGNESTDTKKAKLEERIKLQKAKQADPRNKVLRKAKRLSKMVGDDDDFIETSKKFEKDEDIKKFIHKKKVMLTTKTRALHLFEITRFCLFGIEKLLAKIGKNIRIEGFSEEFDMNKETYLPLFEEIISPYVQIVDEDGVTKVIKNSSFLATFNLSPTNYLIAKLGLDFIKYIISANASDAMAILHNHTEKERLADTKLIKDLPI